MKTKGRNRKGQVTLFIILALIIFIIVGFLYSVMIRTRSEPLETQAETRFEDFLATTNFKLYFQSCLEQISAEAIQASGLQGGRLYREYPEPALWEPLSNGDSYPGPTISDMSCNIGEEWCRYYGRGELATANYGIGIPYEYTFPITANREVIASSYGIKNTYVNLSYYPIIPPYYPYNSLNTSLYKPSGQNSIGTTLFPALCTIKAASPSETVQKQCPTSSLNAIQKRIENYIDYNIYRCFFASDFFKQKLTLDVVPAYGFGLPGARVVLGEEDVKIYYAFPVNVTVKGKEPKTIISNFSSQFDIRYKQAYEVAYRLAEKETENIFFALKEGYITNQLQKSCAEFFYNYTNDSFQRVNASDCVKDDMAVSIIRNAGYTSDDPMSNMSCNTSSPHEYGITYPNESIVRHCESASIIKITDNRSSIKGDPFEFIFSIENRAPALDFISRKAKDTSFYAIYLESIYNPGYNPRIIYTGNIQYCEFFNGLRDPECTAIDDAVADFEKDIIVEAGEEIKIIPFAIDPDEEEVIYEYSGWLTNNTINDLQGNDYDLKDSYILIGTNTPINYTVAGGDLLAHPNGYNVWHDSEFFNGNYIDDTEIATYNEILKSRSLPLNIFDDRFAAKDANYVTSSADAGYHWVRVYARDKNEPERLYDYQDIFIQVRCIDAGGCCDVVEDYHNVDEGVDCMDYFCGSDPKTGYCLNNGTCDMPCP